MTPRTATRLVWARDNVFEVKRRMAKKGADQKVLGEMLREATSRLAAWEAKAKHTVKEQP